MITHCQLVAMGIMSEDLSYDVLLEIMQIRQAVFVVEQHCAYQDLNGL